MVKETLSVGEFQRRMRRLRKVTEKFYLSDSARVTDDQWSFLRHSIFLRSNLYLVFFASSAGYKANKARQEKSHNSLRQKKVSGKWKRRCVFNQKSRNFWQCSTAVYTHLYFARLSPWLSPSCHRKFAVLKDEWRMLEDEMVTLFTRY